MPWGSSFRHCVFWSRWWAQIDLGALTLSQPEFKLQTGGTATKAPAQAIWRDAWFLGSGKRNLKSALLVSWECNSACLFKWDGNQGTGQRAQRSKRVQPRDWLRFEGRPGLATNFRYPPCRLDLMVRYSDTSSTLQRAVLMWGSSQMQI